MLWGCYFVVTFEASLRSNYIILFYGHDDAARCGELFEGNAQRLCKNDFIHFNTFRLIAMCKNKSRKWEIVSYSCQNDLNSRLEWLLKSIRHETCRQHACKLYVSKQLYVLLTGLNCYKRLFKQTLSRCNMVGFLFLYKAV